MSCPYLLSPPLVPTSCLHLLYHLLSPLPVSFSCPHLLSPPPDSISHLHLLSHLTLKSSGIAAVQLHRVFHMGVRDPNASDLCGRCFYPLSRLSSPKKKNLRTTNHIANVETKQVTWKGNLLKDYSYDVGKIYSQAHRLKPVIVECNRSSKIKMYEICNITTCERWGQSGIHRWF